MIVRQAARDLDAAGIDSATLDARILAQSAFGLDWAALVMRGNVTAPDEATAQFNNLVSRRLNREPVALILGEKEFWGLTFRVEPCTLVPRPDSETIVEAAIDVLGDIAQQRPVSILDLGTGTGCLLLALLHEWPNATGLGIDIEPAAVRLAGQNADRLGLSDRVRFAISDWFENVSGRYDLIVANPPYICADDMLTLPPDVAGYEPQRALDGGPDGLEVYRFLAKSLPERLNPDGVFVLEAGAGQAQSVAALMFSQGNCRNLGTRRDLAGIERCVVGQNEN